jgi:hypothetical protein
VHKIYTVQLYSYWFRIYVKYACSELPHILSDRYQHFEGPAVSAFKVEKYAQRGKKLTDTRRGQTETKAMDKPKEVKTKCPS